MKTLGEFIQRLQVDPAFEEQAQAFNNGDDLMAFVKSEGYDFTLEQLMEEFKRGAKLAAEAGGMAPGPTDASASTPPDDPEFSPQPEAFPLGEESAALDQLSSDESTQEPPGPKLQEPQGALPPPDPEKESPAGLFRSGGGRHRGFSPQRLKSIAVEDS
jgi:predicted ribosomally synthesized peptide with nif11-like leader